MNNSPPKRHATSFRELQRLEPWRVRSREFVRKSALFLLSQTARISSRRNCVSIPLYHHVFDDEGKDFERHLKFLRNHGEFIALDDAVTLLSSPAGIDGTYFSITFDDGFRNCWTNAVPILLENKAPATFYLPTDFIGKNLDSDWPVTRRFYETSPYAFPVEFLNWDECRRMQAAGMTLGGHTCSHVKLSSLSVADALNEMAGCKQIIERELGRPCAHFAAPWGRPGLDFDPAVHPALCAQAGYKSFVSNHRGANYAGANVMLLNRENFSACDANWALKYFLAKA